MWKKKRFFSSCFLASLPIVVSSLPLFLSSNCACHPKAIANYDYKINLQINQKNEITNPYCLNEFALQYAKVYQDWIHLSEFYYHAQQKLIESYDFTDQDLEILREYPGIKIRWMQSWHEQFLTDADLAFDPALSYEMCEQKNVDFFPDQDFFHDINIVPFQLGKHHFNWAFEEQSQKIKLSFDQVHQNETINEDQIDFPPYVLYSCGIDKEDGNVFCWYQTTLPGCLITIVKN